MKKNIAMRVAAFLFILTMISTCAFATTFAKYTTSGSSNETARVAKWGVTVVATTPNNTEYEIGESAQDAEIYTIAEEKTLAPGSQVRFASFTLSGTPEVAVKVTYTATLVFTNWKDQNGNDYCPLVFVVDGKTIAKTAGETNEAYAQKVVDAIAAYSETLEANQDVSTKGNLNVSCQWAFEGAEGDDAKDTHLGNQAAVGNSPVVSLSITCTVSQVN